MVDNETAGDPMSEQKWVRSSLRHLQGRLEEKEHTISHPTVGRLLKKHRYSLKANLKTKEASSDDVDRDIQFQYIAKQKQTFQAAGLPVISIDTKKKN